MLADLLALALAIKGVCRKAMISNPIHHPSHVTIPDPQLKEPQKNQSQLGVYHLMEQAFSALQSL